MKTFFFPFAKKYTHLSQYAWHRFAIVAYWIVMVVALGGIWFSLQIPQNNRLSACYQVYLTNEVPEPSPQALQADCSYDAPSTEANLIEAVIAAFVLSYLLQIFYYIAVVYVALGDKNKRTT